LVAATTNSDGCAAHIRRLDRDQGGLHVIGGRFNISVSNTDLNEVYLLDRDDCELRASMPTVRSGHRGWSS
jgi:hypothetical protein